MTQTLTIDVPLPWTRQRVGYRAVSDGYDGFSVTTDGHVWLTANGGSTFTAHAKHAVRVHSTDDSAYVFAEESVKAVTTGDARVVSGGGVRIIAGVSAKPKMQRADENIDAPDAVTDLEDGCDTVATAWSAADLAINVMLGVKAAGIAALAGPANARVGMDVKTVSGALSLASNVASAATNAAIIGDAAPAINMHGTGGINVMTPAFASFYGVQGMLVASPYATQVFGGATVAMVGLGSAGLSALGKVDVTTPRGVNVETGGPLTVRASVGEVFLKGKSVDIGQTLPDPMCPAQIPTSQIGVVGLAGVRLVSPKGNVQLGRTLVDVIEETKLLGLIGKIEGVADAKEGFLAAGGGSGGGAVAGAAASVKVGTRNVMGLPSALRSLQSPAKDPVLTGVNTLTVGGATVMVVKEAVKIAGPGYTVTVDESGITLAQTKDDPLAEAPEPIGANVVIEKSGVTMSVAPKGVVAAAQTKITPTSFTMTSGMVGIDVTATNVVPLSNGYPLEFL